MENVTTSNSDDVLVLEVSSREQARREAAGRWGIPADEVVLNVLEEEKGFLGLFGRKLKVEARRAAPAPAAEEEGAGGSGFTALLERVIKAAGLELEIHVQSDGSVNLTGPDSRYLLAERRGEGLKALDYIVNLMARNEGPVPHVRVDCEGFRRRREKELERIAMDAAKEAMRTRRTVYLPPMSSWERRVVHLTLRESSNVETHSIGVEPGRKVAVRLVGAPRRLDAREGAENAPRRRARAGRVYGGRQSAGRPQRRARPNVQTSPGRDGDE